MRAKEPAISGHYANVTSFLPTDWRSLKTWLTYILGLWYRRRKEGFSTDQWRTQHELSEPKLSSSVALAQWNSFRTEESRGREAWGKQGKHPLQEHLLFGIGKFGSRPYPRQQGWGWKEIKSCFGCILRGNTLKITQNLSVKVLKDS